MGYELLEAVTALLQQAGLRAGEEYPAGERREILSPAAAVGLRELDPGQGTAVFTVRVLSPRMLGGWCCQVWAARAVEALTAAGLTCQTGVMEYKSGSDCFCVALTARQPVVRQGEDWVPARERQILIGQTAQDGVVSFRAARSQGRRIVGASWQGTPVGVTPGKDGWTLELIQRPDREPETEEEPFTLTLLEGEQQVCYIGCCWDETVWKHDREGSILTRRGFALEREVQTDE